MFTFAIAIKHSKIAMENEQIDIILQNEGLNASQLAERLNVQRAQISHLQSNRNRVSLDIVKRIHHAFPHIRLEWLIDHEGDYWNPDVLPTTTPPADATPPASSASSASPLGVMRDLFGEPDETPQMAAEIAKNPAKDTGIADFLKENEVKEPTFAPKEAGDLSFQAQKKAERRIVELKIFYNDGTYETFVERKGESMLVTTNHEP